MRRLAFIVIAVAVVALYLGGRLDGTLYKVGLNYNDCAKNAFGAVFCGDELTSYNQSIQDAKDEADAELQRLQDQAEREAAAAETQHERYLRKVYACLDAGKTDCPYGE